MLDEYELIIEAMKKGKNKICKKTIHRYDELLDSLDSLDSRDVISEKLANKEFKKRANSKKISNWSNKDFLIYFNELLNNKGSRLISLSRRDCNSIAILYDKFVKVLDDKMNNEVLKDYIEWWVNTCLNKNLNREIQAFSLDDVNCFSKFILRYTNKDILSKDNITPKTEEKQDINKLYELSGLRMVLLSFGIIEAVSLLKDKKEDWINKLTEELQKFDKQTIIDVMKKTISKAPYDKNKVVDFISLTKDILRFHGVKDYQNVSYTQFFR